MWTSPTVPRSSWSDARPRALTGERPSRLARHAPCAVGPDSYAWRRSGGLLREVHPHDGFCVHATEVQALAEDFPLNAKLLYAPRALLELVGGGQPHKSVRGTLFFQVTPVCVIAAGPAFAKMHEQFFGDEYYYPVPYS